MISRVTAFTAFITSSGTGRAFVTEWHCPGLATAYSL